MNYQRIHDEIIENARLSSPIGHKHNNKTMGYKELHHIFPRCLALDKKNKLLDIPSNLIYLTARQHFIIHHLLTKIHPNNKKIFYAFHMMFNGNTINGRNLDLGWNKLTNKKYEHFRIRFYNLPISEETRKLMSLAQHGKITSLETRIKISNKLTGRTISNETRNKLSISNCGKTRTHIQVVSKETRKKISISNTGKSPSLETRIKMSESAKNRPPITEETRQKISTASKGRTIIVLDETRKKMSISAKNKPKMTSETKQKISNSTKGKKMSLETRQKISNKLKGRKLSNDTKQKISETLKNK